MKLIALIVLLFASVFARAEDGDYTLNLRSSPLGWVVGPNVRIDVKIAEHWSLGLAGNSLDRKIKTVNLEGKTASLYLTYALYSALTDTWFFDVGVGYGDIRAEASSTATGNQPFERKIHNTVAHYLTGYQWYWSRFNLSLGGGLETNSDGDTFITDNNGTIVEKIPIRRTLFILDASLGFAF